MQAKEEVSKKQALNTANKRKGNIMKKLIYIMANIILLGSIVFFSFVEPKAEIISSDKDYGTGSYTESYTTWNSAANGQFLIREGDKLTFSFHSISANTSTSVFGWVAEVTDLTSYFTITQGRSAWIAPTGCEWAINPKNYIDIKADWTNEYQYIEDVKEADVILEVIRDGKEIRFDSTSTGKSKTYHQHAVGYLDSIDTNSQLYIQLGSDQGSMTLYSVKYQNQKEQKTTETETQETATVKLNLNPSTASKEQDTTKDKTQETVTAKPNLNNQISISKNAAMTLKAEKGEYEKDETIHFNVVFSNQAKSDLTNIDFSVTAPNGYEIDMDDDSFIAVLEAGEKISFPIRAIKVTEKKEKARDEEDNKSIFQIMLIICIVLLIIWIFILVFILKKRKKNNLFFPLFILLLTAYLLPLRTQAASKKLDSITAEETVYVDGEELRFEVKAEYNIK